MAPDLDRALILGGFSFLAMAACASLVVLSEPLIFNIQVLITPLIIVISLSHTHTCVQHLKDYNFRVKKFCTDLRPNPGLLLSYLGLNPSQEVPITNRPETPINVILIVYFIM